ncbi:hypothetical protein DM860_005728 [Cuscuta australis]|uniref:Uncharacterized protein n=1 Tax=Cuscuta australis TaxID=267555 RepID=A0A328DRP4_9ASTE|nr:hypothetical protein DM860_005728 [Cuscuta australis]
MVVPFIQGLLVGSSVSHLPNATLNEEEDEEEGFLDLLHAPPLFRESNIENDLLQKSKKVDKYSRAEGCNSGVVGSEKILSIGVGLCLGTIAVLFQRPFGCLGQRKEASPFFLLSCTTA